MSLPCQKSNARLYYDVCDTTNFSLDEITGRPIYTTTENVIELSIEASETEPSYKKASGGTDEVEVRIEGRCVNPKVLPPEVKSNANYRIEYQFGLDQWRNGRLHILPEMVSRLQIVDKVWGDKIFGLLVTSKNERL